MATYLPPSVRLLGWRQAPAEQYDLLRRAGLLSLAARADPGAVVDLLADLRREAHARWRRGEYVRAATQAWWPSDESVLGLESAAWSLARSQVAALDHAGYIDGAARDAFDAGASRIADATFEQLGMDDAARQGPPAPGIEGGLTCGFCGVGGLPWQAIYCPRCGYSLHGW